MPIYEYQCLACGHRHEQIQRLDDPPLAACPDCGGALKKLVSSPAFQFKGTGWYVTDYAAKKGAGPDAKTSGKGDGAEASAGASSEKSSESGAAKAEAKPSSDSKSTDAAKTPAKKESAKAAES